MLVQQNIYNIVCDKNKLSKIYDYNPLRKRKNHIIQSLSFSVGQDWQQQSVSEHQASSLILVRSAITNNLSQNPIPLTCYRSEHLPVQNFKKILRTSSHALWIFYFCRTYQKENMYQVPLRICLVYMNFTSLYCYVAKSHVL